MDQPSTPNVRDLFESDQVQFEIPVYQRAYVWTAEHNWAPLWQDILDTIERYVTDPDAGRPLKHFLGPIVLQQLRVSVGTVERRVVIDGQQRLTTLQVVLAAARAVAEENDCEDAVEAFTKLLTNSGRRIEGHQRFKVLPSRRDREQFVAVMERPANSVGADWPETGILGAFTFFRARIREWLTDTDTLPNASDIPNDSDIVRDRTWMLRDCLAELVYVVAINLDDSDNAQVIFETLNARGTALGALDLVKNALFRATDPDTAEKLHDQWWDQTFEQGDYWREEIRQGRDRRPRADWFLMHWLAVELGQVVRADRLFDTFRRKFLHDPDVDITQIVPRLCADARLMREFDNYDNRDTPEGRFFDRLEVMDTTTMLPAALLVFRSERDGLITAAQRRRTLAALESWLVRRTVLRLTSQNYNRVLTAVLAAAGADLSHTDDRVIDTLRSGQGNATRWPHDAELRSRLEHGDLYGYVGQRRVRMLLEACELDLRVNPRSEPVPPPEGLTIEHIMPQQWEQNWALPPDQHSEASVQRRTERVHRLGNLTLVTQPLNSSLSNAAWVPEDKNAEGKRAALDEHSLLKLNRRFVRLERWDEDLIDDRGRDLTDRILATWPGPDQWWSTS